MKQYETFELSFPFRVDSINPAQIDLSVTFRREDREWTVRGFCDGDTCRARFLPELPGTYRWEARGILSASGEEECLPADGDHHGPVRAEGTRFIHADGTFFLPFGTTVYALASQEDALVDRTLRTLSEAPFNKIRMGVFPKDYEYNHNEPPLYPFEQDAEGRWDVRRPCFPFWRRFEAILDRIGALGIEIDLILFHPYDRWGFSRLSPEEDRIYLDYLLRRLAARPEIWWSLANEYDLFEEKSPEDWDRIEAFVAENDPFGHLLSCHNCFCLWDAGRPRTTHASIQTKALSEIPFWFRKWGKPVIIDECCYEGNIPQAWGSISGREMVRRFWRAFCSGAGCTHGETFLSEDEVLWWAKGGVLKGQSPARIAFLRQVAESLPCPPEPLSDAFRDLSLLSPEEMKAKLEDQNLPAFFRLAMKSLLRMPERDRTAHLAFEFDWACHCGEEAFLWYTDLHCYAAQTLPLPESRRYTVEVIDTWEMTREIILRDASGLTEIRLPGREGIAVLATANP